MSGGHYSVMYPSQASVGAHTLMPMYPMYQYHPSQAMGLPAQYFTSTGPITAAPAIYSKPTQVLPPTPSIYFSLNFCVFISQIFNLV